MMIRVSPTEPNPTHDISLSDGVTTIGLHLCNGQGLKDHRGIRQGSYPKTSLQISQGDPNYSGFNLPATPVTQKDWSGGRGSDNFSDDATRYYDSRGLNTWLGDIILGPRPTQASNYGYDITNGYTSTNFTNPSGLEQISQFTPWEDMEIYALNFRTGFYPTGTTVHVKFTLYPDNANAPKIATPTASFEGDVQGTKDGFLAVACHFTLKKNVKIWIGLKTSIPFYVNDAGLGIYQVAANGTLSLRDATHDVQIGFELNRSSRVHFFEYRNNVYTLAQPSYMGDSGEYGNPIMMNGYHGFAIDNSSDLTLLKKAASGWSFWEDVFDAPSAIVVLVAGPGSEELQNWRRVVSRVDNYTLKVSPPWLVPHTAATEFAVIGVPDHWMGTTNGGGFTQPVTDICVVDDIVYFCQGDATPIKRGRWAAAGWEWADEPATNAATFMKLIPDSSGKNKIWRAQATTCKVASSDVKPWGTNLAFGTDVICGSTQHKITNLLPYGDQQIPYVLKEDSFGSINNGVYAPVPLHEMRSVRSERNGRAACQLGVYLFFSMLDGFERFYDNRLDDIGPNRDAGLPADERGAIVDAIPYLGGILVAVDAGDAGYSSVLFYNQLGWHKIYRSERQGERIGRLHVQVLPGVETPDWLWISQGETIYIIPISGNPRKQINFLYNDSGYLITSWIKTNLAEINKFFKALNFFTEGLSAGQTIGLDYQLEGASDSDPWLPLPAVFTSSPSQRLLITNDYSAAGKRIRFKLTLSTSDPLKTPRVIAMTLDAVTRVPAAKSWQMTFQADDVTVSDSDGEWDINNMDALLDQLETWANSDEQATPLLMRSLLKKHDNKWIFFDSPGVQLREVVVNEDTREVKAVGNLAAYEA